MPVANSTTSTPRWMSPLASGTVLPCSLARSSASESCSARISSRKRIITRARFCGFCAAQAGCAALAFSTAARSSALLASATRAWISPVVGLNTSAKRPLVPSTVLPPMKCPIVRMAALLPIFLARRLTVQKAAGTPYLFAFAVQF
ncbi:hypothetical protein AEGHOMDF_2945 [Methylobacterium soli]|nr:hypothetical protein AEGHOMDF_2945 [Methylobacterium soli]